MRYLAIDLGDKRTGLAVGDTETGIVSPVGVLEQPMAQESRLLDALAGAVEEYGPGELVLGLPLNMDDTESPRSRLVRAFGARLGERVGLTVNFHDERLSTDAAHWEMAKSGLTHKQKKQRRDAVAAAAILRDFLNTR